MSKDTIRVKKGMVFWFDDMVYNKSDVTMRLGNRDMHSFVQYGKRPCVVLSCDESNSASQVCNIAPITSSKIKLKKDLPSHVVFSHKGEYNTIMIEQIKTVDIVALGAYQYTLSDSVMKDVEMSILSQFGINTANDMYIEKFFDIIMPVINDVIGRKARETQSLIDENKVEAISTTIVKNIERIFNNDIKETQNINTYDIECETDNVQPENLDLTEKPQKWSIEQRRQFLRDCDINSIEEVANKWGMTKGSVYSFRYRSKKMIAEYEKQKREV